LNKPPFSEVWNRIVAHEGELFHTISNLPFKYQVGGNIVVPDRTRYLLHKSDLEKAYELVPMKGPGIINDLVRGPAYIWAILHGERILLCQ
jgi:hypothetical protein